MIRLVCANLCRKLSNLHLSFPPKNLPNYSTSTPYYPFASFKKQSQFEKEEDNLEDYQLEVTSWVRTNKKHKRDGDHHPEKGNFHNLQVFKYKAEKINKFQQLLGLYRRSLEQKNIEKYFISASINFSRIIRRFKSNEYHDVGLFIGNDYEVLNQIDIKKIHYEDLVHIANLLNTIEHKLFLNTTSPNLYKFVEAMVNEILIQLKKHETGKEDQINKNLYYKDKSIAIKMLRTSQIFMLTDAYEIFLDYILRNIPELDLFEYLSIYNTLLRNNNSRKVNEIEKKFVGKTIETILKDNWISISSMHSFCDLAGPILTITQYYPEIRSQNYELFSQLQSKIEAYLLNNYQKISGEEIIRILKIFSETANSSKLMHQFLKTIFNVMQIQQQPSGHLKCISKIDPIFSIRLLGHAQQHLSSYCPTLEQEKKLLLLLQNYFVSEKVCPMPIMASLNYLLLSGSFSQQFDKKAARLTNQILSKFNTTKQSLNPEDVMSYRNKMEFAINATKSSIGCFNLQYAKDLFTLVQKIGNQEKIEVYYYYMYMETVGDFFKKNGLAIKYERPQISQQSTFTKKDITVSKGENPVGFLRLLYLHSGNVAKTGSRMSRLNSSLLQANISFLKYSFKYLQFLSAFEIIDKPPRYINYKLYTSFMELPVPSEIQLKLMKILKKSLSVEEILEMNFNWTRNFKNINLRVYQPQAIQLFQLITHCAPQYKEKYYSDTISISFLLRFLPHQSIQHLLDQILTLCHPQNNYQNILINLTKIYENNDPAKMRIINEKLLKGVNKLIQKNHKQYYNGEIIEELEKKVWLYGGQINRQPSNPDLQEKLFRSIICEQSNKSALNDFLRLFEESSCQFSYKLIKMFLGLLNLEGLQSPQNRKAFDKVLELIVDQLDKDSTSRKINNLFLIANKNRLLLELFVSSVNAKIYNERFEVKFIKLIKSDVNWKGAIVPDQVFQTCKALINYKISKKQDPENIMRLVPIMINLFWCNPQKLYYPLMQVIGDLESEQQTKCGLKCLACYQYLFYLKSLPHNKFSFSIPHP